MSHRGRSLPKSNAQPSVTPTTISWPQSQSRSSTRSPFPPHNLANPDDFDNDEDDDDDSFADGMDDRRPPLHRPTDGKSHTPLLHKDDDEDRGRTGYASPEPSTRPPLFTRRSTMRSRSPDTQAKLATRKKYTYAAFFLGLSLVSFVVQTETAVYIQHELGWNKAYCML